MEKKLKYILYFLDEAFNSMVEYLFIYCWILKGIKLLSVFFELIGTVIFGRFLNNCYQNVMYMSIFFWFALINKVTVKCQSNSNFDLEVKLYCSFMVIIFDSCIDDGD